MKNQATGPAIDVGGIHAPRCSLAPGHVWHGCVCPIIDKADRPCIACEPLKVSAKFCRACKLEWVGRQAFVEAVVNERARLKAKASEKRAQARWDAYCRACRAKEAR